MGPKRVIAARAGALALAYGLAAAPVIAADGALDPSFDTDGAVTVDMSSGSEWARGVAVQPDGKIVVVGTGTNGDEDIVVLRLNLDGSRDLGFGTSGRVTLDYDFGNDRGWDVAVQPDGKIVVVGSALLDTVDNGVVVRLNADGTADTTFNAAGVSPGTFAYHFGDDTFFHAVAVQPDGKIVVTGRSTTGSAIVIARVDADGALDTGFAGDGVTYLDGTWGVDEGWDVALQPDGKILVAGFLTSDSLEEFVVARLRTYGALDTTFNGTGVCQVAFTDDARGRAVALQPDGRIVIAGSTDDGSAVAIARVNADGSLDTTFSKDGKDTFDALFGLDEGWDLALQDDGRIVVAGFAQIESKAYFGLVRWSSIGALDTAFGDNGLVAVGFAADARAGAVALQPGDHKAVLVGHTHLGAYDTFAITRQVLDESFLFADDFEWGNLVVWSSSAP